MAGYLGAIGFSSILGFSFWWGWVCMCGFHFVFISYGPWFWWVRGWLLDGMIKEGGGGKGEGRLMLLRVRSE